MVTTVVPAASTSPDSADFTSTTPSIGGVTSVSESCCLRNPDLRFGPLDFAWRCINSCFATLHLQPVRLRGLAPRLSRVPRRRAPAAISSLRGPSFISDSPLLRLAQHGLRALKLVRA